MQEVSANNNWPSCCPIIRYDVQNDIIEKRARQMIESSYRISLIYYIALLFNLGAIIALAVTRYEISAYEFIPWIQVGFFGGGGGIIAIIDSFSMNCYVAAGLSIVSTAITFGHLLLHVKLCREVRIFYMKRCKDEKPEREDF